MLEREYDVIVYGAGPDGVAAALAAASLGARTLLADVGPDVGGSAVCGLMNSLCDGAEGEEDAFFQPLTRRAWGRRIFEPEELSQVMRRKLAIAGVELMLGAQCARVKVKKGAVRSVSLAAGRGRVKLSAWCYVDATEDYLFSRLAGCCFEEDERDPAVMLLARISGIDTRVSGIFDSDTLRQYTGAFRSEQAMEDLPDDLAFPSLTPCVRGGTAILNACGVGVRVAPGPVGLTDALNRCREGALAALGFLQRNVPGYENCYLIHFAPEPVWTQVAEPVRRWEGAPWTGYGQEAIESIPVHAGSETSAESGSEKTVSPVLLGSLLCPDCSNLLYARPAAVDPEQVHFRMACGSAAGRASAQAVLYDGDLYKLDAARLKKALEGGERD